MFVSWSIQTNTSDSAASSSVVNFGAPQADAYSGSLVSHTSASTSKWNLTIDGVYYDYLELPLPMSGGI
jgi:hypothetical protein